MRLKKELKINFRTIKKFVIAILFLSSLQIFLSVFGYFPFFKRLNFSIGLLFLEDSQVTVFSFISALKIAILIGAGFFIFLKNKFNLKQIFLISILLLSASILSLLLTDRLFSGLPLYLKF